MARVVVETPLLALLVSELAEALEEAPVDEAATVEVPEAGSLLSLFEVWPFDVLVSAACQSVRFRMLMVGSHTSLARRTDSSITRRTLCCSVQSSHHPG
jgi:hypothetical protein